MADQHHAGVTKRSGFPLDTMPVLDGLARSGVAFERAYACAPLCVPSRVSLLTAAGLTHTVFVKTAPRGTLSFRKTFLRSSRRWGIEQVSPAKIIVI